MKTLCIAVVLSVLLGGCGEQASPPAEAGAPSMAASSKVSGVIDAVSGNAITLAGKTYTAQMADVSYEGLAFNVSMEQKGMAVTATLTNNNVTEMVLEPAFVGIAELNLDNQLLINGMVLSIPDPDVFNLDYKFGGGSLGWVMVFAHLDSQNQWVVTNVSPVNAMPSAEVEGRVSGLTDKQFQLSGEKIDYMPSAVAGSTTLANGMYVQVFGQFTNGLFTANRVDIKE